MTIAPARLGHAIVATLLVTLLAVLAACSAGPGGGTSSDGGGSAGSDCPTEQPAALPTGETRTVTLATELGAIVISGEADLSPIAVGTFVALAECGFYDGVGFHRVVPGFVIQGGDPTGSGGGGPGYTIKDEPVTAEYRRGTLAMARSSRPDSQGSQFFLVLDDEAAFSLEMANTYAIMGEVTSGMEVADAIAAAADREQPTDPVVMTDVSVATP